MAKYQAYADYKDSGLEWLGEIPSHWKVKKLKYLGEAIIGLTYSPDDVVDESEGTLVLRSSNIQNKKLAFEDNVYVRKEIPEKLRTQKNDILICARNGSRALIGKNALIDESAEGVSFGAFMSIFRSEYNSYLSKVFNSALFEYQSGTFLTATINQLTTGNLNSFEVPLPPLTERNQISNFLDYETRKIDHLIEKQQQLIELLKEKRQAVISHAVTKGLDRNVPMKDSGVEWLGEVPEHWQTPCTKYLLEIPITDGPHETPQFVDEGIPFISAEAIHKGKINFDKKRGYIKPELNDIYSKKYSPKLEDIYMVKSGATTGKVAMVETEEKFNIWSPLAVFRCNKIKILPKFLLAVFNSNHFYDALVLNWSYGTQQNIGMGVLSNIEIPCPPINEQEEIIQHIDNELKVFKNLENKANHAIQLMQERRTALISAAVTGKIDVRNWQAPTLAGAHTELSA